MILCFSISGSSMNIKTQHLSKIKISCSNYLTKLCYSIKISIMFIFMTKKNKLNSELFRQVPDRVFSQGRIWIRFFSKGGSGFLKIGSGSGLFSKDGSVSATLVETLILINFSYLDLRKALVRRSASEEYFTFNMLGLKEILLTIVLVAFLSLLILVLHVLLFSYINMDVSR